MSKALTISCDYPLTEDNRCSRPARWTIEARSGHRHFAGEFCDPHRVDVEVDLLVIGLSPKGAAVDNKPRNLYVAASGVTFTTRQAREWLVGQGYDVSSAGRLGADLLELYAAAH